MYRLEAGMYGMVRRLHCDEYALGSIQVVVKLTKQIQ